MSCTGPNETGDCTFNGGKFWGNINANTLTLKNDGYINYELLFYGNTTINTLIIDVYDGKRIYFSQYIRDKATITINNIIIKDKTKPNPASIGLATNKEGLQSTLKNLNDTGGATVNIIDLINNTDTTITPTPQGNAFVKRKYKFGGGGEIISITGPGASYLTGGGGSSGGGSSGSGGSGSSGGGGENGSSNTPKLTRTQKDTIDCISKLGGTLQAVQLCRNTMWEREHLESTNTLILYNILNNYDGTYINYDYGLGHQVGIGAFNNGGFARYYNYNSKNGFDIGAKLKIAVANKLYLRGVAYYTYFGSSTLASHSLVFGLGVLKNFDFALGSSGNVFWVLNPSANLYYAATLKGTYMPANHLGFGNVALDTGLRIKNTSLLLRGSAGGVLNSLKSIGIDLGNGANYKNTTFFNNAIYSASFVFSQKFPLQNHNGRFYLNADIGGVFVDRVLDSITNKPYILKAGMLLGYEFGGDSNRATRQSSRYQKLKNKNARKTLSTPTSNQTTTNNKRATSLAPKADSTNNAKSTPLAKTPAKDSNKSQKPELTKAEKKAQKQAQKEAQKAQKKAAKAAKSTPPKSTPPKINLPKVPKSSAKQSAKQNTKPTKPTTKPTNAKPSTPTKPTKPTKQTKAKK
ncbi:hypothetical protein [Helicobacter macacae]|uniref:Uncharacterized protein n=1 Tax=Helicobacter macacae MIT 99-5501 TaxID=1357400 RepID=V8CDI4_9HELI|nr:hypothetical protein [Helicobacter macacae]ETD24796.1 hypothetical protein HMPREF2086_00130 [Helicobacter macacae MIT 99-5501]